MGLYSVNCYIRVELNFKHTSFVAVLCSVCGLMIWVNFLISGSQAGIMTLKLLGNGLPTEFQRHNAHALADFQ